jgi:hypothetical protein
MKTLFVLLFSAFSAPLRLKHSTANAALECTELETANAVTLSQTPEDGWYLIAPYGEFPRPQDDGEVQIFHREQAENVVRTFNSIPGKAARYMKSMWHGLKSRWGVPAFEGHADSHPGKWRTLNQLAEVNDLRAEDDGLWGHITWNADALARRTQELGPLKPSPLFWHEPRDDKGRVFPEMLESIGLVVHPNIKTAPAWTANAALAGLPADKQENENQMKHRDQLIALLGLKADATDEAIQSSLDAHGLKVTSTANALASATAEKNELQNKLTSANGAVTELTTERDGLKTKVTELTTANGALTTERNALVDGILTVAEKRGIIAPADKEALKTRLTTANTAPDALKELGDKKPVLNTKSVEIGNNRVDITTANARHDAFNREVKKREKEGMTYDEAFAAALNDPALAALTGAMKEAELEQPATA